MNKSHNGPDDPRWVAYQREGFCLNGVNDPARRAAKLKERIKHLMIEKARIDDQIEIMQHELHGIEVRVWIESIDVKAYLDTI